MYLSLVTLSEFGQFLQILLWVFLPIFILSLLVTTYLHYRKRARETQHSEFLPAFSDTGERMISPALRAAILSSEGEEGFPERRSGGSSSARPADPAPAALEGFYTSPAAAAQDDTDNPYKGLLWMKNKYEQDRELADMKYEQLKMEFRHSEEKYSAALSEQKALRDLLNEKDFRLGLLQNQLDDRQSWIDRLNEQAQQDKTRCEELAAKLELSSQLLLKIHQELDRSRTTEPDHLRIAGPESPLRPEEGQNDHQDPHSSQDPQGTQDPKIVSWMESGPA
jgi:hypothetical protein